LNTHKTQLLLILAGIGTCTFGLGVLIYTFVTRMVVVYPLRRLRAHAQALVTNNTGTMLARSRVDEIRSISHAFAQLSESIDSESQAMTEQMSNLLIMSDALVSTLN